MPFSTPNPFLAPLFKQLEGQDQLESKLDELRKFKNQRQKGLGQNFLQKKLEVTEVMRSLTQLADAILIAAHQMAQDEVRRSYGLPEIKDNDGNFLPSQFALIGMGKLGGNELHFDSDLDVIFVFDRNGETRGGRTITNREFYAKVAQRIISFLTLYTTYRYAYKVDTELRPSGQAGALVTPLDPWISYYHEHAATWEKQALLKARLIEVGENFSSAFKGLFRRLIFLTPFSDQLGEEIHHLRIRIEKELARETPSLWDIKKGYGGLVDIEFAVQYLQLKLGKVFEFLCTPNTLEALERIAARNILSAKSTKTLKEAYLLYRNLEFIMELKFELKGGYLNKEDDRMHDLAHALSFKNKAELIKVLSEYRDEVRSIYLGVLKINRE